MVDWVVQESPAALMVRGEASRSWIGSFTFPRSWPSRRSRETSKHHSRACDCDASLPPCGCFYKLKALFVGVLKMRAPLYGVHTGPPEWWNLPDGQGTHEAVLVCDMPQLFQMPKQPFLVTLPSSMGLACPSA